MRRDLSGTLLDKIQGQIRFKMPIIIKQPTASFGFSSKSRILNLGNITRGKRNTFIND